MEPNKDQTPKPARDELTTFRALVMLAGLLIGGAVGAALASSTGFIGMVIVGMLGAAAGTGIAISIFY